MIDIVNIKGKEIIFIDELSFGYPFDMNLSKNDIERIGEAGKIGQSAGIIFRKVKSETEEMLDGLRDVREYVERNR